MRVTGTYFTCKKYGNENKRVRNDEKNNVTGRARMADMEEQLRLH
jgi:hypothetical protein